VLTVCSVLSGLFAAFSEAPGARREGQGPGHTHAFDEMPMNPFMGLFAAMSGGQHGDFVYSQEALDRIITQLMEQTASSNAPGPAPQDAIDALPKPKITEEMLGAEGRAECSICMDEVNIGEEVTQLPCKHWFHPMCVEAWLHEHDTCPHCRQGIAKHENEGNTATGGSAPSSGSDPTASMPGAFGVVGDGSLNNPFVVPGTVPPSADPNTNASQTQGGAAEGSSGGGIGDRWRRGWSDAPSE
jgi:E3 ubiquitin-protein ligase RNF115/126